MNLDVAVFKTSIYIRGPRPRYGGMQDRHAYVYVHSDGAYIIIVEASYNYKYYIRR